METKVSRRSLRQFSWQRPPKTRGRRTQKAAKRKCQPQGGSGNPKKSVGHLLKTPQMKYWFMDQHRSWHGVQRMCRVIGASRSGYYRWRKQPQSKRQKENEKILIEIKESHKNSRRIYGSPRITNELHSKGIRCGKNRVARIMKIHGIVAKAAKKCRATTNSKHNLPVPENLVNP